MDDLSSFAMMSKLGIRHHYAQARKEHFPSTLSSTFSSISCMEEMVLSDCTLLAMLWQQDSLVWQLQN